MLCRRHHREKATPGWHIEHLWPGVILWITPTGHWRITAPADGILTDRFVPTIRAIDFTPDSPNFGRVIMIR